MGSGEPALVPEWYRAGKVGKNPNANSGNSNFFFLLSNFIFIVIVVAQFMDF